jgi:hypothetical protein
LELVGRGVEEAGAEGAAQRCAASCRSLAIDVRGFAAENIYREIKALLD